MTTTSIVPHPDVARLVMAGHALADSTIVHTDLTASGCACLRMVRVVPQSTGNSCAECGGMTVQTGTCSTCTSCGTSGGCG